MRLLALAVVLAGAAAGAAVVAQGNGSTAVATVDGSAISRRAYDEYASVFTTPDGSLRISEEDVLLSLVNQVLVEREAERRGITVADGTVSDAVAEMQDRHAHGILALPGNVDDAAFRERVRLFLLFRLVKEQVIGPIDIPIEALEAKYGADPSLHILGFQDASRVIRERLVTAEAERRWVAWLKSERACADIRVLDAAFDLPSSTPVPGCPAATHG